MGNQGWLHRSCGLRARRKRSRGQAERADGKPECGELYRGGPRLSGPIHRRFSLFAQKNSEVGAATPTSKRAIPASPPYIPPGTREESGSPAGMAGCRWPCDNTRPCAFHLIYCNSWGRSHLVAASRRSARLLSAQGCMGKPVTCWDSWGQSRLAAVSRRCSGSDP